MTETGRVARITSGIVVVECNENHDCHSCTQCDKGKNGRSMQAVDRSGVSLSEGDLVEVYLPPGKAIKASFIVLIFPLILFILFYYAVSRLLPEVHEAVPVLSGFVGIAVGFALNILFRNKTKDLPIITRKIEDNG